MVIYMYEKSLYPVFPAPSDCTVYMVMTEPGIKFEDEQHLQKWPKSLALEPGLVALTSGVLNTSMAQDLTTTWILNPDRWVSKLCRYRLRQELDKAPSLNILLLLQINVTNLN